MEKDLWTYLERMKREGELFCIDHEVDPRTEAPALIKRSIEKGKALLLNVIRHVMGFSRDPYHRYKSKLAVDATSPIEQREHFRRTRIINDGIDLERYFNPKGS